MIHVVAAMSKNRVIGRNNALPWKLPEDLKRFKQLTTGQTIVMGRKTHESIGSLLPNRETIIVSRNLEYAVPGALVVPSIEAALLCAETLYVVGGGEIYKHTLPYAERLHLTVLDQDFEGDAFFPELSSDWEEIGRTKRAGFAFIEYQRGFE